MFEKGEKKTKKEFKLNLLELELINEIISETMYDVPNDIDYKNVDITLIREENNKIVILYNVKREI